MKVFLTAMLIVGTIIGAGFASGGEIAVYYAKFGYFCIPAIIFTGVLFFFIINLLLKTNLRAKEKGISVNKYVFGRFSGAIDYVLIFNCFIILSSMFAGSDVIGVEFFPATAGFPAASLIMFIGCLITVRLGIKGLMSANAVMVPLILIFITVISIYGVMCSPGEIVLKNNLFFIFINPFLYTGINMLLSVGAVSEIKVTESEIKKIAAVSSVILTAVLLLSALAIVYTGTTNEAMPTIIIAGRMGTAAKIIGGVLILAAVFTTMQTAAYTLSKWMSAMLNSRTLSIISILTIGWCLSRIGFSNIIAYVYPVAGVFGTVYFLIVFIAGQKNKKLCTDYISRNNKTACKKC